MKFLNFAEAYEEHWLWVSKNPEKARSEWPRWLGNGGDIPTHKIKGTICFPCVVAIKKNSFLACRKCPVKWPNKEDGCGVLYRAYLHAKTAGNFKEVSKLAFKIANLEWKGQKVFKI